jgi:tRNA(Ile)-lysidine synthase
VGSLDVPGRARESGVGLEETARIERYRFLEEAAKECGAQAIALGHTRDDQVETILHRILRGAGLRGLTGMQFRRGKFIRPLLDCGRRELIEYLRERRISYIIDRSNQDNRFYRNRIRNKLLPYLRRYFNPSVDEALLRLGAGALEGWQLLEDPIKKMVPEPQPDGTVVLPLSDLETSTDFEIYLMIDLVLRERFDIYQDVERKHFDAAKRLIRSAQSGKKVQFPHKVIILKEQQRVVMMVERADPIKPQAIVIPSQGRYELAPWNLTLEVETLDGPGIEHESSESKAVLAKVSFPIRARPRQKGDRLIPFGMRGHKKLSDLFIDKKTPLTARDRFPVFEDSDGIFWVPGLVAAERTRISGRTRRAVRIALTEGVDE